MKRIISLIILTAAVICTFFAIRAAGAEALDEILLYDITVDVNQDGTLYMVYHIDWKVLNSDDGGVSWVHIGIPNNRCSSYYGLTSNVTDVTMENNGGSVLRITFDREYMKNEVISFEFALVQDYMYEMNGVRDGETHYEFTPGWFNDIKVDSLVIGWNSTGALSASPANHQADGCFFWATSLEPGETYTVSVDYPNDAFGFDASKSIINGSEEEHSSPLTGLILTAVFGLVVYAVVKKIVGMVSYKNTANMGAGGKKITHEKIVYFPTCPGCGAPREEGKDSCQYCGKSLIKSKETVTEEQVPEEIKQKTSNGTYHYGSDPNTFMRVHVVPVSIHTGSRSSGVSRSSGGGRSCACASHCACACACACAGGGRAGCSAKNFYNTDLKLSALEKSCKK